MTANDDFDRISRAWLDLMPDEAPDRALDAVLRAVATTPQMRRWRPASWRPLPMNRLPFALAAAAIAVAIGGAVFLMRPGTDRQSGGVPTPSVSPSPATSTTTPPAGGSVPAELKATWMGGPNDFVADGAGSSIILDEESLELTQSNDNDTAKLTARSSISNAGLIHLTGAGLGPCEAEAGGDYDWSLSPSGRVLTLAPIEDACTQRGTALAGTWWRMGCTTDGDNCLGLLDAGTYKSQFITPRLAADASWRPMVGALTYTVPEGWANSSDWPDAFELVPAAELPPVAEIDRRRNIGVFRQPSAMTQDRPCSDEVEPGVGRTVDDLIAWLQSVPGLNTTEPTPITIGGHGGQMLDLERDPAWTATCEGSTERLVTFLNPGLAVGEAQRNRVILLDIGDGDVVAIGVWTRDQATFDAFVPEAMQVIGSFQFE